MYVLFLRVSEIMTLSEATITAPYICFFLVSSVNCFLTFMFEVCLFITY
jgi:hypothetical protein